jgi:hypothetical protein
MSRKNRRKPRYVLEEEAACGGPPDEAVAPVDIHLLSAASQRSWGLPCVYRSTRYQCIGCGKDCVYTAMDQKRDYEIKKFYFCTRRTRCEDCHREWGDLRAEIRRYPERLRAGVSVAEAALMHAGMERYRQLNGSRFDRALYDRIAKFRIEERNSD